MINQHHIVFHIYISKEQNVSMVKNHTFGFYILTNLTCALI